MCMCLTEGWKCKSNAHISKASQIKTFFRLLSSICHGGKEPHMVFNNTFTENVPVWVSLLEWPEHYYIHTESTSICSWSHTCFIFLNHKMNTPKGLQCNLLSSTNPTTESVSFFWKRWKRL